MAVLMVGAASASALALGQTDDFPAPTAESSPFAIAVGPEGIACQTHAGRQQLWPLLVVPGADRYTASV